MERYFKAFSNGYTGYFNYLLNEMLNPSWHNYFYWLVGLSLTVWALEILFPWRKDQPVLRQDFFQDLFYLFFNFFLFSLVGYNALSNVGVQAFSDFLGLFGIRNLVAFEIQSWPVWGQLLTLFIVRDFIQWNVHRLLHNVSWMWEFHKVHHSVEQMGFAAHLRYHWMETIIYRTFEYIPLAMIGFGIQDFFLVHIFTLAIGHLNHANIDLPLGPLRFLLNSPQMHLWHHVEVLPTDRPNGINYGITLSIWDYLFRTAYQPYAGSHLKLGFPDVGKFPHTLREQLLHPWHQPSSASLPAIRKKLAR
ncbi:sterol desaturase family protein [Spirosoma sp. SC4-14]|uniref:sterol desaturase family protein n=1 Tax=Spirosoma sp. SC4-14 TaxID=3128900 RepID=UPI0030D08FAB